MILPFTEEGTLIFLTSTHSQKWMDLEKKSSIAVCLLNLEVGQIIVEDTALLHSNKNDLVKTSHYWIHFLPKYWQDFYLTCTQEIFQTAGTIPESFGVIEIIPYSWEILEINTEDFLKGSRKKFILKDQTWDVKELPLE